jgi:hypothetical protein
VKKRSKEGREEKKRRQRKKATRQIKERMKYGNTKRR